MSTSDRSGEYEPRVATVKRATKETSIHIILAVDGGQLEGLPAEVQNADPDAPRKNAHAFQSSKTQYIDIDSGIGFLDHMYEYPRRGHATSTLTLPRRLHALSKHAGWSLYLRTNGDLHSPSSPPLRHPHSPRSSLTITPTQSMTTTPPKTRCSL